MSREIDPNAFAVATVGSFQAGTVGNVIPDHAELRLSLRSFDPAVRAKLKAGVARTAKAAADMAGAPAPNLEVLGDTSAMRNDSALVARVSPVVRDAFGDRARFEPASAPGFSGSEDFAILMEAGVPSVFYWIGAMDPEDVRAGKAALNHSPLFKVVPEPTIRAGALVLALSVLTVAPAP